MKKGLVVMLGLMTVIFLSACNKWQESNNLVVDESNNPDVVVDLSEEEANNVEVDNVEVDNTEIDNWEVDSANDVKTSLTLADLNEIEALSFPISYSYERYWRESSEPSDSGTYAYSNGDHWLLPIYENIVSKEVVESESDWWWIYTTVAAVLNDESECSIVYMNDPVTLRYVAATVSDEEGSTLYSFNY